jgi:hypothetical protein
MHRPGTPPVLVARRTSRLLSGSRSSPLARFDGSALGSAALCVACLGCTSTGRSTTSRQGTCSTWCERAVANLLPGTVWRQWQTSRRPWSCRRSTVLRTPIAATFIEVCGGKRRACLCQWICHCFRAKHPATGCTGRHVAVRSRQRNRTQRHDATHGILARSLSQGGGTGSNPVGAAKNLQAPLRLGRLFPFWAVLSGALRLTAGPDRSGAVFRFAHGRINDACQCIALAQAEGARFREPTDTAAAAGGGGISACASHDGVAVTRTFSGHRHRPTVLAVGLGRVSPVLWAQEAR